MKITVDVVLVLVALIAVAVVISSINLSAVAALNNLFSHLQILN